MRKPAKTEDERDFALTLELAREGSPSHQIELAQLYLDGTRVPKNDTEAFRWFLAAASQGDSEGMYMVAVSYLAGVAVERNKGEAIKWLSRLAEPETTEDSGWLSRMADAQALMAAAYYTVPGEPHDPVVAYGWLLLAISYGQPWTDRVTPFNANILNEIRETLAMLEDLRQNLESNLTSEQRAQGQKMAADLFRPKSYVEARRDKAFKKRLASSRQPTIRRPHKPKNILPSP